MKIIKTSVALAMMLTASTSAFSADSLQEAFKSGKFDGQILAMYVDGNKVGVVGLPESNKNGAAIAAHLNYVTSDFKGFKVGMSFQASHDFRIDDTAAEHESRLAFSRSTMSQAYLDYAFAKSSLRVGKQIIKTPLILNSSAWPMYDSYTGAVFTTKAIPKTMVKVMYLKDWHKRTKDSDFHFEKPVYSIFAVNQSIENLKLMGQYMTTDEKQNSMDMPVPMGGGYSTYFVQADYKFKDLPLTLAGQYGGATFDASAEKDVNFYGVKVGTKLGKASLDVAYTKVGDDNDFPGTLGHTPNALLFNPLSLNHAIFAGLGVVSAKVAYNFNNGLKVDATCASLSMSEEGKRNSMFDDRDGAKEVDLNLSYKFSGSLKGLGLSLRTAYAKYDLNNSEEDTFKYVKAIASYKF